MDFRTYGSATIRYSGEACGHKVIFRASALPKSFASISPGPRKCLLVAPVLSSGKPGIAGYWPD